MVTGFTGLRLFALETQAEQPPLTSPAEPAALRQTSDIGES